MKALADASESPRGPCFDHHGNTVAGLSSSMQDMIQHILASPVPVAVYVSPTGGARSLRGLLHPALADIAADGAGYDTGSATPVMAIGGFSAHAN